MFLLTEVERISILSGCIGLVCIVVLLTVCFVCPFCWFHKIITSRILKKDAGINLSMNHIQGLFLDHEQPRRYGSSNMNSFYAIQSPLKFSRRLTPMNRISTIGSNTDSVTGIPLPVMGDTVIPAIGNLKSSFYEPGKVSITLQFKRIAGADKKVFSLLRFDINEAADLPLRAYGGICDPYFIIGLYDKAIRRKKNQKPGSTPVYEFSTRIVKKSQYPVYKESFFFPLEPNLLKKSILKIEAWDHDKWANDSSLGEVFFNLKDITAFLLQEPPKELDLTVKLEDSKLINGQILLGLCYLPTSERITVTILKANNLETGTEKNDSRECYIQAMSIYGGNVSERRKTSSRPSSSFTVFNEMLMFDAPFSKLDQIVLLLTIRSSKSKDNAIDKANLPKTKDPCIGKVVIGSYSRKNSLKHWNAMRSSPRQQVIQWHELR